jgi:hypothetical protein
VTGVDAKRILIELSPHNRVDISGQEYTDFPVPGGKTGGPPLRIPNRAEILCRRAAATMLLLRGGIAWMWICGSSLPMACPSPRA